MWRREGKEVASCWRLKHGTLTWLAIESIIRYKSQTQFPFLHRRRQSRNISNPIMPAEKRRNRRERDISVLYDELIALSCSIAWLLVFSTLLEIPHMDCFSERVRDESQVNRRRRTKNQQISWSFIELSRVIQDLSLRKIIDLYHNPQENFLRKSYFHDLTYTLDWKSVTCKSCHFNLLLHNSEAYNRMHESFLFYLFFFSHGTSLQKNGSDNSVWAWET